MLGGVGRIGGVGRLRCRLVARRGYNADHHGTAATALALPHRHDSTNRDHTLQGMRRQEQWRALRRHHVRGLQGLLPALAVVGGQLSVSTQQELRRRPRQSQSLPVLSPSEMPSIGHESRCREIRSYVKETARKSRRRSTIPPGAAARAERFGARQFSVRAADAI